jgi:hypothetical protein
MEGGAVGHNFERDAEMILGWPPSKIVSVDPDFQAKNRKRGDEILIVHNCSYMARSSLTYIPGFGQLKKFLFLVTAAILNGGWGCRTQF